MMPTCRAGLAPGYEYGTDEGRSLGMNTGRAVKLQQTHVEAV